MDKVRKELKQLRASAKELIDFGDSHEKAQGRGMLEVITAIRKVLPKK